MKAHYMKSMIVTCFCAALLLAFASRPTPTRAQGEVTVMGYPAVYGYLVDHPIDPNMLILATPNDRFAILPLDGCESFGAMQDVFFYTNDQGEPFIFEPHSSPHDINPPYNCHIRIIGPADPSQAEPCYLSSAGLCDVRQEEGYQGQ